MDYKYKKFWICLLLFLGFNLFLYLFILFYNHKVPFNKLNYTVNAYHYFTDARIQHGNFDLLRALGQYDAQWYLTIASVGYPKNPHPHNSNNNEKQIKDGFTYSFFPFYPLVLAIVNIGIKNIEVSAFLVSNLVMFVNFISLYFVLKNLSNNNVALKSIFLLFCFPFSIFYRSYFTEGLFLLFLIWFSYFLIKKRWLLTSFFLSLLLITRPTGPALEPIFFFAMLQGYWHKQITLKLIISSLFLSLIPFLAWLVYCFIFTGNPFYWAVAHSSMAPATFPLIWLYNINLFSHYLYLPLHSFHASKVDILMIIIVGALLFYSWKKLKTELWWISFALWLWPLLVNDTISYSRYQIISFPLFFYLAQILKGFRYKVILSIFCLGLFLLSLFFVNWYWIG